MNPKAQPAKDIVASSWGRKPPAWIAKMADFCDAPDSSQAAVAKRMGRSASLVNQVLRNTYKGDMAGVEARFTAAFKGSVICPVLGQITGAECLDWQGKPYCAANHHLVRMFRACRQCPHRIRPSTGEKK